MQRNTDLAQGVRRLLDGPARSLCVEVMMVKIGECIYYGRPYRGTCPTCNQVFLNPCGGSHIALRERFCSDECAKNFKWDIRMRKEMLAELGGTADHHDIEDAVVSAVLNGVIDGVTK